jgi:hypothetical protein
LFSEGIKADFVVAYAELQEPLMNLLRVSHYKEVFARGFRILKNITGDEDNNLPEFSRHAPTYPTREGLTGVVDEMLIDLATACKLANREDFWRWHNLNHGSIRPRLLTLIEWLAALKSAGQTDTFYEGRNITTWASSLILERLEPLFPGFAGHEIKSANRAMLGLTEDLAGEIAGLLLCDFPTAGQHKTIAWLRGCF